MAVELRSGQRPGVLDLFASGRFPTRSDLKQYEDSLQEQSCAVRFFQPRAQELLTAWGGCGTTQVVVGRDGWLFYRPGIDSVIGTGFLEPQTLRRRLRNWRDAAVTETVAPDPRPAILEFQQQIEAAGARLILLPIPDKASLQAAELGGRRAVRRARPESLVRAVRPGDPRGRRRRVRSVAGRRPAGRDPLPGPGHALDAAVDGRGGVRLGSSAVHSTSRHQWAGSRNRAVTARHVSFWRPSHVRRRRRSRAWGT